MCDIKELRIGSHVEYEGKRVRVHSISSSEIFYLPCIVSSIAYHAKVKDLQPILITPELLKEIGFKYHEYDNGNLWEWNFEDLYKSYGYLEFDEDTTTVWRGRLWHMKEIEMDIKVEFLHELENIFYLIYVKELIKD